MSSNFFSITGLTDSITAKPKAVVITLLYNDTQQLVISFLRYNDERDIGITEEQIIELVSSIEM